MTATTTVPIKYTGLATRAIAFIIDVIIIDIVAVASTAAGALIVSFFHTQSEAKTILKLIAAGLAVLWTIGYFVVFWSTTGQTPGNRLMQIRVTTANGGHVKPSRAFLRFVGLVLAALPLFAGYLLILFDRQRRGLQDRIAGTVVVEAPNLSVAAARRARQREARAYEAARGETAAGSAAPPPAAPPLADGSDPAAERRETISVTR